MFRVTDFTFSEIPPALAVTGRVYNQRLSTLLLFVSSLGNRDIQAKLANFAPNKVGSLRGLVRISY